MFALVEGAVSLVKKRKKASEADAFRFVRLLPRHRTGVESYTRKNGDEVHLILGSQTSIKNVDTFSCSELVLDRYLKRQESVDNRLSFKGHICTASADGKFIAFSNRKEERIYLLDPVSNTFIRTIPFPRIEEGSNFEQPIRLWISNDGNQIVALVCGITTKEHGSDDNSNIKPFNDGNHQGNDPRFLIFSMRGDERRDIGTSSWEYLPFLFPEGVRSVNIGTSQQENSTRKWRSLCVDFANDDVIGSGNIIVSYSDIVQTDTKPSLVFMRQGFKCESSLSLKYSARQCCNMKIGLETVIDFGFPHIDQRIHIGSVCSDRGRNYAIGLNIGEHAYVLFRTEDTQSCTKVLHLSNVLGITQYALEIHDMVWTCGGLFLLICFSNGSLSLLTNSGELLQLHATESTFFGDVPKFAGENIQITSAKNPSKNYGYVKGSYMLNIPFEEDATRKLYSGGIWMACACSGLPIVCVSNGSVVMAIRLPQMTTFKELNIQNVPTTLLSYMSLILLLLSGDCGQYTSKLNQTNKNIGLIALHENDTIRRCLHAWNLMLSVINHSSSIVEALSRTVTEKLANTTIAYKGDRIIALRIVSHIISVSQYTTPRNVPLLVKFGRMVVQGLLSSGHEYEAMHIIRLLKNFIFKIDKSLDVSFYRQLVKIGISAFSSPPLESESSSNLGTENGLLSPWTNSRSYHTDNTFSDDYLNSEEALNERHIGKAILASCIRNSREWTKSRIKVRRRLNKVVQRNENAEYFTLDDKLIHAHFLYLNEEYKEAEMAYKKAGDSGAFCLMCLLLRRCKMDDVTIIAEKWINAPDKGNTNCNTVEAALKLLCDILFDYFSRNGTNGLGNSLHIPSPLSTNLQALRDTGYLSFEKVQKSTSKVPNWSIEFASRLAIYIHGPAASDKLSLFLRNVTQYKSVLSVLSMDVGASILTNSNRFLIYRRHLAFAWLFRDAIAESHILQHMSTSMNSDPLLKINLLWLLLNFVRNNLTELIVTDSNGHEAVADIILRIKHLDSSHHLQRTNQIRIESILLACISLVRSLGSNLDHWRHWLFFKSEIENNRNNVCDPITKSGIYHHSVRALALCIWMVHIFYTNRKTIVNPEKVAVVCSFSPSVRRYFKEMAVEAAEDIIAKLDLEAQGKNHETESFRIAMQHLLNNHVSWHDIDTEKSLTRVTKGSNSLDENLNKKRNELLGICQAKISEENLFEISNAKLEIRNPFPNLEERAEVWFSKFSKQVLGLMTDQVQSNNEVDDLKSDHDVVLEILMSLQQRQNPHIQSTTHSNSIDLAVLVNLLLDPNNKCDVPTTPEKDNDIEKPSSDRSSVTSDMCSLNEEEYSEGDIVINVGNASTSEESVDYASSVSTLLMEHLNPYQDESVENSPPNWYIRSHHFVNHKQPTNLKIPYKQEQVEHGNYKEPTNDSERVQSSKLTSMMSDKDTLNQLKLIQSQNQQILLRMENLAISSETGNNNNANRENQEISKTESDISLYSSKGYDTEYSEDEIDVVKPYSQAVRTFQRHLLMRNKRKITVKREQVKKESYNKDIKMPLQPYVKELLPGSQISQPLLRLPLSERFRYSQNSILRKHNRNGFSKPITKCQCVGTEVGSSIHETVHQQDNDNPLDKMETRRGTKVQKYTSPVKLDNKNLMKEQNKNFSEHGMETKESQDIVFESSTTHQDIGKGKDIVQEEIITSDAATIPNQNEYEDKGQESEKQENKKQENKGQESEKQENKKQESEKQENQKQENKETVKFHGEKPMLLNGEICINDFHKTEKDHIQMGNNGISVINPCFSSPVIYFNLSSDTTEEIKPGFSTGKKSFIHVADLENI